MSDHPHVPICQLHLQDLQKTTGNKSMQEQVAVSITVQITFKCFFPIHVIDNPTFRGRINYGVRGREAKRAKR